MTKTAFLFAGQGAQYLGMGRDFYDQYPIVKETIDRASQVLGYDLRYLIDTEEDKLNQTRYTQPAILATSVAIYRLLQEKGYQPDMVAGLSLGEYSALVASGALDFEDAVALVAKRGAYMEEAAPADSGKMVAVLNTPVEVIEEACQKASELGVVTPANYNTPAQIVIAGEVVASQKLAETLAQVSFSDFTCPLVGNTEAAVMQKEDIAQLLTRQVKEPVRFYESIGVMQEAGISNFIEIGPGKVLSGFVKKIDQTAHLAHVEDQASLVALLEK